MDPVNVDPEPFRNEILKLTNKKLRRAIFIFCVSSSKMVVLLYGNSYNYRI